MTLLTSLTLAEAHQKIRNREVRVIELVQAYLHRIKMLEPQLGAFITVCADQALQQAEALDQKIAKGAPVNPLTGGVLAPKDIYLTKGIQTTAASKILEGFVPPYNSTVIEKCLGAGMVIIGKTNMDEFAMGSSTENSAYKISKNPWNTQHIPGGSSGGSAVAVSADLCMASLGTDTGGSIRQPASHCSIVGLKPTYGRVSRYGTIAFASSLDQMGPMTKTVTDTALLMNAIAGFDERDSTSQKVMVPDYTQLLGREIKGTKIGVPKEFFESGLEDDVKKQIQSSLQTLQNLGCELIEVSLPRTEHAVATYYVLAPAEASSNLARYDGVRFGFRGKGETLTDMYRKTRGQGFGSEVKRRILIGTYVLSAGYYDAYYVKAKKARELIKQDYADAFKKVDIIAGPVSPCTAFKLGEKLANPLQMYLSDILTISANLSGLPGMSVPSGFDSKGLPIGLQLIGKSFDEAFMLQVAFAFENETKIYQKRPLL